MLELVRHDRHVSRDFTLYNATKVVPDCIVADEVALAPPEELPLLWFSRAKLDGT